jgi:hypothetical protein
MRAAFSPAEVRSSPKKARKPQERSLPLRHAIEAVAEEYERFTVRQLFYQLVSRGKVEKTEQAYKRVCDAAVQMRLDGSLPYSKISDGSRARRKPPTWKGAKEVLEWSAEIYRHDYWTRQPFRVEVWCEKDALSGVIQPVCDEYGVTYVATRGFPSQTLLYESAVQMAEVDRLFRVYYFGDHDASGRAIDRNLESELKRHGALVVVRRVALEPWQIDEYRLPTRPGKTSDSRHDRFAAEFGGASVELDALPPDVLAEMVDSYIKENIVGDEWAKAQHIEKLERKTLEKFIAGWHSPLTPYGPYRKLP